MSCSWCSLLHVDIMSDIDKLSNHTKHMEKKSQNTQCIIMRPFYDKSKRMSITDNALQSLHYNVFHFTCPCIYWHCSLRPSLDCLMSKHVLGIILYSVFKLRRVTTLIGLSISLLNIRQFDPHSGGACLRS